MVWVLFMEPDGTVMGKAMICSGTPGFSASLIESGRFGYSVASIGTFDDDTIPDIAVGAAQESSASASMIGAVYLIMLLRDGTVRSYQTISEATGGFALFEDIGQMSRFGSSIVPIGDQNGDGITDLAVGASGNDGDTSAGSGRGALYILYLTNPDATGNVVQQGHKIGLNAGNFGTGVGTNHRFGQSVTTLDVNGDGLMDFAVGAKGYGPNSDNRPGAVWIIILDSDLLVAGKQRISKGFGGFSGATLTHLSRFGMGVTSLGDINGDDVPDLAVGAMSHDNGGAVYILFLKTDGQVLTERLIAESQSGFEETLTESSVFGTSSTLFGSSVVSMGDLDGDGVSDLAVGARGNLMVRGSAWILFLNTDGTVHAEASPSMSPSASPSTTIIPSPSISATPSESSTPSTTPTATASSSVLPTPSVAPECSATALLPDHDCVPLEEAPRGCTYPSAKNFDAAALVDDGTCVPYNTTALQEEVEALQNLIVEQAGVIEALREDVLAMEAADARIAELLAEIAAARAELELHWCHEAHLSEQTEARRLEQQIRVMRQVKNKLNTGQRRLDAKERKKMAVMWRRLAADPGHGP